MMNHHLLFFRITLARFVLYVAQIIPRILCIVEHKRVLALHNASEFSSRHINPVLLAVIAGDVSFQRHLHWVYWLVYSALTSQSY